MAAEGGNDAMAVLGALTHRFVATIILYFILYGQTKLKAYVHKPLAEPRDVQGMHLQALNAKKKI